MTPSCRKDLVSCQDLIREGLSEIPDMAEFDKDQMGMTLSRSET